MDHSTSSYLKLKSLNNSRYRLSVWFSITISLLMTWCTYYIFHGSDDYKAYELITCLSVGAFLLGMWGYWFYQYFYLKKFGDVLFEIQWPPKVGSRLKGQIVIPNKFETTNASISLSCIEDIGSSDSLATKVLWTTECESPMNFNISQNVMSIDVDILLPSECPPSSTQLKTLDRAIWWTMYVEANPTHDGLKLKSYFEIPVAPGHIPAQPGILWSRLIWPAVLIVILFGLAIWPNPPPLIARLHNFVYSRK